MTMPRFIFALAASVSLCSGPALPQDAQSLGDVARQARQQKQQQANSNPDTPSTDPQNTAPNANDPKTPQLSQVITNDEIPEHTQRVPSNAQKSPSGSATAARKEVTRPPEYWKAQVQQLKNSMASLQRRIDVLNGSLHAVLTNSDDQPVWNSREKEKERQLAELQAQMSDLQGRLEDTQEAARRQGYGSSVYDP
jgi:chromosome segregation ATPase